MVLNHMMLPLVLASTVAMATAALQVALAGPNVTATLLVAVPATGALNVTAWRLYPDPDNSVPAVDAVGATLYKAQYTVAGEV
jgi:hypothetical protein